MNELNPELTIRLGENVENSHDDAQVFCDHATDTVVDYAEEVKSLRKKNLELVFQCEALRDELDLADEIIDDGEAVAEPKDEPDGREYMTV